MTDLNHVIMLTSENDALKRGKVGGIGDVIRDLPSALADLGWRVTTIIPSYGFLHRDNPATRVAEVSFPFGGKQTTAEIFEVAPKTPTNNVTHLVVEHPEMRGEPIYFNDPPEHAFARDATKYALFCSAIGQYLKNATHPFVGHLHDWHMGFYFLLRELHPEFAHLKKFKSVYTIHNLAIQGNRPMRGKYASVESWFPELFKQTDWIFNWKDPRWKDPNFTPMAAAIRFADRVNTVSPTYAEEIMRPSDHANGFYGGEGLEKYLQLARKENRLVGILNGIEYSQNQSSKKMSFSEIRDVMVCELKRWGAKKPDKFHDEVVERIGMIREITPSMILTSVTRVTEQKVRLFFEKGARGTTAMEQIVAALAMNGGIYLFLGTGTIDYEEKLAATFRKHERFVYLKGYSDPIAEALYSNGTLFMMPSSFEPCGIGQMIAMRHGQPCVVHATGGLTDTVQHFRNGFIFDGTTIREQVDDFVRVTTEAMDIFLHDTPRWERIRAEALNARFTWEKSARQYVELMYVPAK